MTQPRFIQAVPVDRAGLRDAADLPWTLPHHLSALDVFRLVEDLHSLLCKINTQLVSEGYERLEELLDPAGFSGLLSRAVVDRVGHLSLALVPNEQHNGYPDLLEKGTYAHNKAKHGEGGLEVKASRNGTSWQSHGPRAGWFLILQFELDKEESKALRDREPTRVVAVMVAQLDAEDWNWQPAKEGRIRSGTASVTPSGRAKLRAGAVWVEPEYEAVHQKLLMAARRDAFSKRRTAAVHAAIGAAGGTAYRDKLVEQLSEEIGVAAKTMKGQVDSAVKQLVAEGRVAREGKGATCQLSLL